MDLDIEEFRKLHPQFDNIDDETIQGWADYAALLFPWRMVKDEKEQKALLGLLTCHLLTLRNRGDVSGPLTSASEGKVSTSFASYTSNNGWWFRQTPCGALFWQIILKYILGPRWTRKC